MNQPTKSRMPMSCGLPLQVLKSAAGFYIGTADEMGPMSRDSVEYWPTEDQAQTALDAGRDAWTQREHA